MRFQDKKINEFTDVLAKKDAVPGGGGASALVGAVGIALGSMVGALTVGKKKYADVEDEIRQLMDQAQLLRQELLQGMDDDAESFLPLAKAYGIPKDDPNRDAIMEEALCGACEAPIKLMRNICRSLELLSEFAKKGSRLAISDAGVGAVCAKAALQGASLNVFINTKSMKNREQAQDLEQQAQEMLDHYCPMADEIYASVCEKIR